MTCLFFAACVLPAIAVEVPLVEFNNLGMFSPRQNEQTTLTCNASNDFDNITFLKNGDLLSEITDSRLTVNSNKNQLTITRLNYTTDDGEYQCIANSSRGALLSLKKELKISVLGDFEEGSRYTDPVKTLDVVLGRPSTLNCPPFTYLQPRTFLWGRVQQEGGQPTLIKFNKGRFKTSKGDLFFASLMQTDVDEVNNRIGGISCIPYHEGLFKESVRYRLNIVAEFNNNLAPNFNEQIPARSEAKEGEEFSFYCSAGGKPVPEIKWFDPNGREITSQSSDYLISTNQLKIRVVYQRLAGKYRCEVRNSAGVKRSEGELVVLVSPVWSTTLKDRTVKANTNVQFTVLAKGVGIINYSWFKNALPINRNNATYAIRGNTLTIRNIQVEDFGYIQCFATNSKFEITTAAFLNIEETRTIPSNACNECSKKGNGMLACRMNKTVCDGLKLGVHRMYPAEGHYFLHCSADGPWCKPCAVNTLVYNAECGQCEVTRDGNCTGPSSIVKKVVSRIMKTKRLSENLKIAHVEKKEIKKKGRKGKKRVHPRFYISICAGVVALFGVVYLIYICSRLIIKRTRNES